MIRDIDVTTLEKCIYAVGLKRYRAEMESCTLTIDQHAEFIADALVFQMRTAVWSKHLGDHVVRYPANWWQAFKRRFFPHWASSRWPVLETVVVVQAYHDYPGVRVQDCEPLLHYRQRVAEAD